MKKILTSFITLMISTACLAQVVDREPGYLTADGPYIFHLPDGKARVISVDSSGQVIDTTGALPQSFTVSDHKGEYSFTVTLHEPVRQDWQLTSTGRTFVLSDPHGRMDCLVSILKAGGVIDDQLNWAFGSDRLVMIGDVMDRGDDVTQIFWLLYKLEAEAAAAGGSLTFVYGNHEPMVLAGDLRYTRKKYKTLAEQVGTTVPALYGKDTEIGRWLATRNTMSKVGDDLFVHAGLSRELLEADLDIPELNEIMSRGAFMTSDERKADSELMYMLFKSYGPIWYRGMFKGETKYGPRMEKGDIDAALARYESERVFVGHTIFKNTRPFFHGKVVAVDVDAKINHDKGRTRAVLLEGNKIYTVKDSGKTHRMR